MTIRAARPRQFTLTDVRPGPVLCSAEDVLRSGARSAEEARERIRALSLVVDVFHVEPAP